MLNSYSTHHLALATHLILRYTVHVQKGGSATILDSPQK